MRAGAENPETGARAVAFFPGWCHDVRLSMKEGSKSRKPGTPAEDWISQAEAARIRGVSRQAIGSLVKKGRLRVRRIGGKPLVNGTELERFVPKPGRPRRLAYLTMHLKH